MIRLDGPAREAEARAREAEARAQESEIQARKVKAQAMDDYKRLKAFEADVAEAGIELYNTGFKLCKKVVIDTFPNLDLWVILLPSKEEEEGNQLKKSTTTGKVASACLKALSRLHCRGTV